MPELDGADNPPPPATGSPSRLDRRRPLGRRQALAARPIWPAPPTSTPATDPALRRWRRRPAGFLTADTVGTQVFQIRRGAVIDRSAVAQTAGVQHDHEMLGLMQDFPLTIESILRHGERLFGAKTMRHPAGRRAASGSPSPSWRPGPGRWPACCDRSGVSPSGRVGSFGWNTANHAALYFGVPCTGRVLHTINIRLFAEQLIYTVEHAEDEVVFVDRSLLPLFAQYLPKLSTVRHVVVFDDGAPHELPEDSRLRQLGTTWSARSSTSAAGCATRTPPPRCVTPPAPPATPRACCTRTAPPTCTRWPPRCRPPSR